MSCIKSNISENNSQPKITANKFSSLERQILAIQAISKSSNITHLANIHNTSRKFIYAQKLKAEVALEKAFEEKAEEDKPLFYLPITKAWIHQLVIALILICHSSYSGIIELFRDLFHFSISKGNIHNIIYSILKKAQLINQKKDLSAIKVGAHDEIFQNNNPVLVGCDALSTYCYLLSQEEKRDANTWGVHLLDLKENQNLQPEHTIADGGLGLRKGQAEAWPDIACHGDVFHALMPFNALTHYLDNRAIGALTISEKLKRKCENPRRLNMEETKKRQTLELKATIAEKESLKAIKLADEIQILYDWLEKDILSLIGYQKEDRKDLFNFVIDELKIREYLCSYRIKPLRVFLENNKGNLLKFVDQIDRGLEEIANDFKVSLSRVCELYQLQKLNFSNSIRWEKESFSKAYFKEKFYAIETQIKTLLKKTVRASSVVENINSRLRNYFFLRRTIGKDYLDILQFFLNHRRFMRSENEDRKGKSPAEIMENKTHEHWLEMLGFKLFKPAA
jgi:hypothetical protein